MREFVNIHEFSVKIIDLIISNEPSDEIFFF